MAAVITGSRGSSGSRTGGIIIACLRHLDGLGGWFIVSGMDYNRRFGDFGLLIMFVGQLIFIPAFLPFVFVQDKLSKEDTNL